MELDKILRKMGVTASKPSIKFVLPVKTRNLLGTKGLGVKPVRTKTVKPTIKHTKLK
jgi:hypothetical protein